MPRSAIWAPLLLVLMRVIQGLGAGAEYGGAVIYLVENAPAQRRGFWGSFAPLGVSIGNLLAAGAFALVTPLPREDLMSWGWRLPFLASFLLILVGIFVRLQGGGNAGLHRGRGRARQGRAAIRRWKRCAAIRAISSSCSGARLAENGLGYLFPVFGLSYVITTLGVPKADALSALMLAFVVELFAIVGFASLSDRIGRRPVYMFGALCGVAFAFPFFWLVGTKAVDLDRARLHHRARGGDGGDVRPAGGLLRRAVPAAAALRGLCLRPRTGSLLAGGPAPFLAACAGGWSPAAGGRSPATRRCFPRSPRSRSGPARRPIEENIAANTLPDETVHPTAMPARA